VGKDSFFMSAFRRGGGEEERDKSVRNLSKEGGRKPKKRRTLVSMSYLPWRLREKG